MRNLTLVHSQRNDTCIICGTEFKPRAGKQYCSNACKQKGYEDKKQQVGAQREKEQEIKATNKQFQFYFSEFLEFKKKYPNDVSDIPLYCFFRKNLTGNPTIDQIHEYIKSIVGNSFWDEFYDNYERGVTSPARKRYDEFEAKYFGDEVIISFS